MFRSPVLSFVGFLQALSLAVATLFAITAWAADSPSTPPWLSAAAAAALDRAGSNRLQLVAALNKAPAEHREGLQFLLENMPETDLRSLSAEYVLENVA